MGMNVVACLGETLEERKSDKVEEVCFASLEAIAKGVNGVWDNVVIAYEPVWAIGTGVACDKEKVSEDVANSIRIIYGGSVKPKNCEELIAQPDIDGFLIGGASLKADSFGTIIKAVQTESSK